MRDLFMHLVSGFYFESIYLTFTGNLFVTILSLSQQNKLIQLIRNKLTQLSYLAITELFSTFEKIKVFYLHNRSLERKFSFSQYYLITKQLNKFIKLGKFAKLRSVTYSLNKPHYILDKLMPKSLAEIEFKMFI